MEIGLTEAVRKMASAGALPAAQEGELLFCWDLARVECCHAAVRHHQDGRCRLEAYR